MKHNNIIPANHFRKDWKRNVKLWFDQPARKSARRTARATRATRLAPRPTDLLRPAVRAQTAQYNRRVRAGRGFTLEELKAAGINKKQAIGIGISVDHRRTNKNEEAFKLNVNRLKNYKSKLVLFPTHPTSKRIRKGDATKEEQKQVKQVTRDHVLGIAPRLRSKARAIKPDEREAEVAKTLRKALTDSKLWGQRAERQKKKEAEKAGKAKKDNKDDGGGDE